MIFLLQRQRRLTCGRVFSPFTLSSPLVQSQHAPEVANPTAPGLQHIFKDICRMVPHFTFRNRGGHLILFTVPSLFLFKLRVFRPHCSTGLAATQPQAPSPSSTVACQFLSYRTLKKWEKSILYCVSPKSYSMLLLTVLEW